MHVPGVYNYGYTTLGSGALPAPLLASLLGCARATSTTSTSAVIAGEGRTGATSGQSSSNDHVGEEGLPADRLTLSATSASTLSPVLSSVHAALIDPNWCRAMEEEFAALIVNDTWDLIPRPASSNVFTGKWIFKHKFNSDGSLER
jgi:hypothetical protein